MKVKDALAALSGLDPEMHLGTDDGDYLVSNITVSTFDDADGVKEYAAVTLIDWDW